MSAQSVCAKCLCKVSMQGKCLFNYQGYFQIQHNLLQALSQGGTGERAPSPVVCAPSSDLGPHQHYWQCCSCLFVSGRTVVYRSRYKRPQFPPKVDFGGPNYNRLQASHVASHVDSPSRTLLTVRPARQDAVLPQDRTLHDKYSTGPNQSLTQKGETKLIKIW